MDFSKLQVGDFLSTQLNLQVKKINPNGSITVSVDMLGLQIDINGSDFGKACESATQYTKTKKVNRTELATQLTKCNSIFTATFIKADKTERTLIGYLIDPNGLFGHSTVEDLEIAYDEKSPLGRRRKIDHQKITSLIYKGTKYELKN